METGESRHSKTKSATARHVTNMAVDCLSGVSFVDYDQHKDVSYKPNDKDCYHCHNL